MKRNHKSLLLLTSILDILVFSSKLLIGIASNGDNEVEDYHEDIVNHDDDDDEDEEEEEDDEDDEDDED